jgi:GNAT superfamily N-acetyltransferase
MVAKVPSGVCTHVAPVLGLTLRRLQATDGEALRALSWSAYRDTVDEDDYAEPSDAMKDAERTLAGWWGPLIDEASLAVTADGDLVAAVITVRDTAHDMIPLLAFALTDPAWHWRGIGGWLIGESIAALAGLKVRELHLAVTRGNPAQHLYERLGFRTVD